MAADGLFGRRVAASVMGILGCIVLPLGLVSAWAAGVLTDTNRYVATVAPLAGNRAVEHAVEHRLEGFAVASISPDRAGQPLPKVLRAAAVEAIHEAVVGVVEGPVFPPAWEVANRAAHRELVSVLRGRDEGVVRSNGQVTVGLGPVLKAALTTLEKKGVLRRDAVPDVQINVSLMNVSDLRRAQRVYAVLGPAGFWLPVIWLILAVAAMVVAPNRHRALAWLSVGAMVGVALLWLASRFVRHRALASIAEKDDVVVARAVWDAVVSSLNLAIWTVLIVAVVVFLVNWVMGRVWPAGRRGKAPRVFRV
jgi:hypothetical protein